MWRPQFELTSKISHVNQSQNEEIRRSNSERNGSNTREWIWWKLCNFTLIRQKNYARGTKSTKIWSRGNKLYRLELKGRSYSSQFILFNDLAPGEENNPSFTEDSDVNLETYDLRISSSGMIVDLTSRLHAKSAIEADYFAVEHWVFYDGLDEVSIL